MLLALPTPQCTGLPQDDWARPHGFAGSSPPKAHLLVSLQQRLLTTRFPSCSPQNPSPKYKATPVSRSSRHMFPLSSSFSGRNSALLPPHAPVSFSVRTLNSPHAILQARCPAATLLSYLGCIYTAPLASKAFPESPHVSDSELNLTSSSEVTIIMCISTSFCWVSLATASLRNHSKKFKEAIFPCEWSGLHKI